MHTKYIYIIGHDDTLAFSEGFISLMNMDSAILRSG